MPHKTAELGCVFPGAGAIVGPPEARWLVSVAGLGWPMNRPEVDDRSRLLRLSLESVTSHVGGWRCDQMGIYVMQ